MRTLGVIPARLASTRLPRKVLRQVAGRPLLAWVVDAARACPQLDQVVVAADSDEVVALCHQLGFPVQLTSPDLPSGTDSVNAVGAAGQIGRGELDGEAELVAESDDFIGVSSDDDLVELRAGAGGVDNPGEQRATGDLAKDLARQAGGGETSGNDAEGTHSSLRYRIGRQVHRVC